MPAGGLGGVRVDGIEGSLLARARPAGQITGPLIVARLAEGGHGERKPHAPAHNR